jgi:hypothetical protein
MGLLIDSTVFVAAERRKHTPEDVVTTLLEEHGDVETRPSASTRLANAGNAPSGPHPMSMARPPDASPACAHASVTNSPRTSDDRISRSWSPWPRSNR